MFTHEDERRTLIEWATGNFKECKVVTAKVDCIVGDHWHAKKDEVFLLLSGEAPLIQIGSISSTNVRPPAAFAVPRGRYHAFHLKAGSVLLGTATELYDKDDERTDPLDSFNQTCNIS